MPGACAGPGGRLCPGRAGRWHRRRLASASFRLIKLLRVIFCPGLSLCVFPSLCFQCFRVSPVNSIRPDTPSNPEGRLAFAALLTNQRRCEHRRLSLLVSVFCVCLPCLLFAGIRIFLSPGLKRVFCLVVILEIYAGTVDLSLKLNHSTRLRCLPAARRPGSLRPPMLVAEQTICPAPPAAFTVSLNVVSVGRVQHVGPSRGELAHLLKAAHLLKGLIPDSGFLCHVDHVSQTVESLRPVLACPPRRDLHLLLPVRAEGSPPQEPTPEPSIQL